MKDKLIDLTSPKVMGIINLTDDSFFSESRITSDKQLLERVERMISEGADMIDLGAFSTRPGADNVSLEDEMSRILAGVDRVRREFPEIIISLDTFRSSVAEAGIEAGADMINDISGGQFDPEMAEMIGRLKVPYILMHMRGTPTNMMENTQYDNLFNELATYFSERISYFTERGATDLIIDPGFGFSKTIDQNYSILECLDQFHIHGKPILVGLSRKSMIYKKIKTTPQLALNGTIALNAIALTKGASILRVHDVKAAVEIITLLS